MLDNKNVSRRQLLKNTAMAVGAGATATGILGSISAIPAQAAPIPRKWDREADVIVVGSGPMGLPASIATADKGASAIVLEQGKVVGGCGRIAAGIFNLGGGTRLQKLNGVADTPELLYQRLTNYTLADGRKNDPVLMRAICDANPGTLDWLEQRGVRFMEMLSPTFGGDALHWMQFHYLWSAQEGPGLPNLKLPDGSASSGAGLIVPLENYAKGKGVQFLLEHKMTKIIRENGTSGRVLGVEVQAGSSKLYFKAKKGVILGTGLWKGNRTFRKLWDPRLTEDLGATGEPFVNDDGSGHLAALEAGVLLVGHRSSDSNLFRRVFGTYHYNYPLNSPYGAPGLGNIGPRMADMIFVNKSGRRFMSEQDTGSFGAYSPFDAMLAQEGHIFWGIFDDATAQKYKWTVNPPVTEKGCGFSAPTLTDLAKLIEVPANNLQETVQKYNSYVDQGKDAEFEKLPSLLKSKVQAGPFYAVRITLLVHDTSQCGGIAVNPKCQVLDPFGKVISGLYAGGDATAYFSPGMPKCIIMGRFAGENVLA